METKKNIESIVISPSKDSHKRQGKGFSLLELKESGKSIELLKENKIYIDYFRRSSHKENVELLKNLKPSTKKITKKNPFIRKEKKRTSFKSKEEKPKVELSEMEEQITISKQEEEKPTPKKVKARIKKELIGKKEISQKGLPLTSLTGLGPATASKFIELGVETIDDLINEDAAELGTLIKGISLERIKKWIEEAKNLSK